MNTHLDDLNQLNRSAQNFWHDWCNQLADLDSLDPSEMVQQSNQILQQYLPNVSLERESHSEHSVSTIVFTANGIRDHFPSVQAVVQAAPSDLPYTIQAFRHAIPELNTHFAISIDGFDLSMQDILVRLDQWREMPALEIAFAKPIDAAFEQHAKSMTFIILDHLIGEWNSAVKIDAIDFVQHAQADFIPFIQLPAQLEHLWHTLGRTSQYPQPEWQYANAEIEPNEHESNHIILTRNQSANSLLGRADMAWVVCIHCSINHQQDLQAAYDLQDQFTAYATQQQQGIDTMCVMNLSQNQRSIYAATSDPSTLLSHAIALCERFATLKPTAECEYDPNWLHYRF